jgi:hypothetical protein
LAVLWSCGVREGDGFSISDTQRHQNSKIVVVSGEGAGYQYLLKLPVDIVSLGARITDLTGYGGVNL